MREPSAYPNCTDQAQDACPGRNDIIAQRPECAVLFAARESKGEGEECVCAKREGGEENGQKSTPAVSKMIPRSSNGDVPGLRMLPRQSHDLSKRKVARCGCILRWEIQIVLSSSSAVVWCRFGSFRFVQVVQNVRFNGGLRGREEHQCLDIKSQAQHASDTVVT
jgi:hypothetical protein